MSTTRVKMQPAIIGGIEVDADRLTLYLTSMARLIVDSGSRLAELPEDQRPGTVIVAIMTDGLENASRE